MTSGNNGASTPPEDDDPFGYLYADGQANGAQPPSGGYGYPNSVNRVRAVGQRTYGGQQQAVPQQQGAYGQPSAHYAAPETFPGNGGGPTAPQQPAYSGGSGSGSGRGRGPNTKGLLIGAIAVVAAVVIGIAVAMAGGDDKKGDDPGNEAGSTPTQSESAEPTPTGSDSAEDEVKLPEIDAKAMRLEGGAGTASAVKGAKASGGVYVDGFNKVGASLTWTANGIPESGKYTLYVGYSVPGKDGTATLTVNGTPATTPVGLKNWANADEGDYEKGWTKTYNYVQLNKGTNTFKVSCEEGDQCDALIDQAWLVEGWVDS
ncbi:MULTISPECIES: carbohydrate-binding protein [unclassified Streptomyces]|uniref:carbohydrate-binding protein n=1 Tax=unclassified Streptomyces TaxID=2593676 RepID=UPI0016621898|nr:MULTISPECIES: carbohydrate-binding protein [unclassified Streptomyces]MBD0840322.1 carbohydrate-binding protein [Streptomyces sp. TRM68416]